MYYDREPYFIPHAAANWFPKNCQLISQTAGNSISDPSNATAQVVFQRLYVNILQPIRSQCAFHQMIDCRSHKKQPDLPKIIQFHHNNSCRYLRKRKKNRILWQPMIQMPANKLDNQQNLKTKFETTVNCKIWRTLSFLTPKEIPEIWNNSLWLWYHVRNCLKFLFFFLLLYNDSIQEYI